MSVDLDALDPELARLDALIEAELQRMRARYELTLDEFRGLYITDEQVDALLRVRAQPARSVPDITAARAADTESRWHQLAVALELTDEERDLLLICLAPELDVKYETLFAYLNDDVTRRWPTPELAGRLLVSEPAERRSLLARLVESRLFGLAVLVGPANRETTSVRRSMHLAGPLISWLQGSSYRDQRLDGVARIARPVALPPEGVPAAAREQLTMVGRRIRDRSRLPVIVITSSDPANARVMAEQVAASAGSDVLVVDVEGLRDRSAAEISSAVELAQRVLGVIAIAGPIDAGLETDGRPRDDLTGTFRELVRRSPAIVLTATHGSAYLDLVPGASVVELRMPELSTSERAAVWRYAIEADAELSPEIAVLADRFPLGSAAILRAARLAREMSRLAERAVAVTDLFSAARAISVAQSGGTTTSVETPFAWEDLVLPPDAGRRLNDVVQAIELRSRVLDDWGFGQALGGTRGIKILFAGPPGTGKTMAAGIIARTVGLDMHRVELGATVSKYIGETEKNLDRAFDAARRANALLFIDEADALFGKRSEVKDAHDRYANIEIAYLLQKMEDHDGIVILATNLAKNVDEAFSRRMQFVIEFPIPDEHSRERIWRAMFPASAPVDPDIDFGYLARQFEFTGADIRNVVLDAAYQAAQQDHAITLLDVLRAVAHEFRKSGRVPTAVDFREHYSLLDPDQIAVG